jgi:hypothetical protein
MARRDRAHPIQHWQAVTGFGEGPRRAPATGWLECAVKRTSGAGPHCLRQKADAPVVMNDPVVTPEMARAIHAERSVTSLLLLLRCFLPWVILGIDEVDVERALTLDQHHERTLCDEPVMHFGWHFGESASGDGYPLLEVKVVAHPHYTGTREYSDVLGIGVPVWPYLAAR